MNWLHENKTVLDLPKDCVGFVYQITCQVNGRMYVGKKLAKFKTLRYKMHTQKKYAKEFAALWTAIGKITMVAVMPYMQI
jgi:hypothetical protein